MSFAVLEDNPLNQNNSPFDRVRNLDDLGGILRDIRKSKPLPLSHYAAALRLPESSLEALELGNWATLPGVTYGMGYLKRYSEMLGLNPDHAIACYQRLRAQEAPPLRYLAISNSEQENPSRNLLWMSAIGIALLIALGAGYQAREYWQFSESEAAQSAASVSNPNLATALPLKQPTQTAALSKEDRDAPTLALNRCLSPIFVSLTSCVAVTPQIGTLPSVISRIATPYPIWSRPQ